MANTLVVRPALGFWLLALLLLATPERAWPLAGEPDPTFDGDGTVTQTIPFFDEFTYSVAVQADDKILALAGSYFAGVKLLRFATDGSLDPTFDGDGSVDPPPGVEFSSVQVIGSNIYVHASVFMGLAVVRYDLTGTLDAGYGSGGVLLLSVYHYFNDVTVDSLGRPVAVGPTVDTVIDFRSFAVYRYGLDGNPDPAFGSGGVVTTTLTGENAQHEAYRLVVQPDDKIVALAGSIWDQGGAIDPEDEEEVAEGGDDLEEGGDFVKGGSSLALVRYNTDGTLDTGFSGNGKAIFAAQDAYSEGVGLFRRADGTFVVVASVLENVPGDHDLFVLNFARFNSDGTPDLSLDGDGIVRSEFPYQSSIERGEVQLQPDGKILVGTQVRGEPLVCNPSSFVYRSAILRFNADGTPDRTYGNDGFGTVAPSYLSWGYLFAVDSLGRTVIGGGTRNDECTLPIEDTDWVVSRLLADCTLDGVVTADESCDDGDLDDTNGCDNRCEVRGCWSCTGTAPSTCSPLTAGASCDDANVCTANDQCDGAGACTAVTPTPLTSCIVAAQSSLAIGRGATPAKDKIGWTWKDTSFLPYDFRDPVKGGTGFTLCVFDGAGVLMQAEVPPGAFCGDDRCWKTNIYEEFYRFKDKSLAHGGIEQLSLYDTRKFQLKGKGANLPDSPVLVDPVTIQLIKHDSQSDACFESVYTGNEFAKSTVKGFKGKHKQ